MKILNFLFLGLILFAVENSIAAVPMQSAEPAPEKAQEVVVKDEYRRDNPRSLVTNLLDAVTAKDYKKAEVYFNLTGLSRAKQRQGEDIARQFHNLIDQNGWLYSKVKISDEPLGELEDEYAPELERIGGIRADGKVVPILAERIPAKDEIPAYWQISSETIVQIPALEKNIKSSLLNRFLPQTLIENQINGVPIGHWLAIIVALVASYFIIWSLSSLMIMLFCLVKTKITSKPTNREIIKVFILPVQLFLSLILAMILIRTLGISMLARQAFFMFSRISTWLIFAWVIWRLIDVGAETLRKKLFSRGQYDVISAVILLRRGAKATLLIILLITILDNFGYAITTWIAALGIGGIAVALGTQKTVENFVGSLNLIADRPIGIGDFCRFGTATGTVEDIGMRSTRIRTPDRTIIIIPNGEFSSLQIENYTKRDSYFFNPVLNLSYETTAEQLKAVIAELKDFLSTNTKVRTNSAKVLLAQLGETSLRIEITAYMVATNMDEANSIKEELNIEIIAILNKLRINFALPNQRLFSTNPITNN